MNAAEHFIVQVRASLAAHGGLRAARLSTLQFMVGALSNLVA